MTDIRTEGAATSGYGKLQSTFGQGVGDVKSQVEGGLNQAKGAALQGFGKALDAADSNLHRVPADMQPAARQAIAFGRERPFVTMFGLAAAALVLLRGVGGRRRR